jgi:hypothetical protein
MPAAARGHETILLSYNEAECADKIRPTATPVASGPSGSRRGVLDKLNTLVADVARHPCQGLGKLEPLRGDLAG